jgi:hypothetical protein
MKTKKEKMLDLELEVHERVGTFGLKAMKAHDIWFNQQLGLSDDANEDPWDIEISEEKILWLISAFEEYLDENP